MSVLIKGMKMPEKCVDCPFADDYMWCKADVSGRSCPDDDRPRWCPLIEIPPHGDLIDKGVLYNKTAEWEASALAYLEKLDQTPLDEMDADEKAVWRRWTAILVERSAFKHDVFDAPVVIEAEGEEDGGTEGT